MSTERSPRPVLHYDLELARRLERANARDGELAAEAEAAMGDVEAAVIHVAGGSVIFCGAGSFLTHALAVGVGHEVSDAELDAIERFYFERDADVELDLCPLADPTLAGRLFDRGFRPDHFECVLVRRVDEDALAHASLAARDDIEIAHARPEDETLYARGLADAFASVEGEPELHAMVVHVGRSSFRKRGGPRLMAWTRGAARELVAAAALNHHDGVAQLSGAWTRADHRGRGIQRALIDARLHLAARAGCDLAQIVGMPGTTTQRNAERCGFHPAYTRLVLVKRHPARATP